MASTGDTLLIRNFRTFPWLNGSPEVQQWQVKYNDGIIWDQSAIQTELHKGTSGNDLIAGTLEDDVIHGQFGDDVLIGFDGDDLLEGGAGVDVLYGGYVVNPVNDGNDTLDGGVGADNLYGGLGDDTYIVDNTLDQVIESADADGLYSYDTVESSVTYTAPDFVEYVKLTGSENINATANNAGCDLDGNEGNNHLKGGDNLDYIFGDLGTDTLEGGAGDDYYYLTDNQDTIIEAVGAGLDKIDAYGDGIVMAANVERLYMKSYTAITATGNDSKNTLSGNNRNNVLYGMGGNDYLSGATGADSLYGGLGNDSLNGGRGNDRYFFMTGDGADTIDDFDTTAGNSDKLVFEGSVASSQLWLTQSGTNLVVSLIGTTDKVTINNWYSSDDFKVETLQALGDGKTLTSTKVDALVSAMAAFTPPAAGQTTLPANYQTALNGVIAANWV